MRLIGKARQEVVSRGKAKRGTKLNIAAPLAVPAFELTCCSGPRANVVGCVLEKTRLGALVSKHKA
jgi:hypothetical protein